MRLAHEAAAKQLKVSSRSVETARAVKKADPAAADEVKQGKTKLADAAKAVAKKMGPPSPAFQRADKLRKAKAKEDKQRELQDKPGNDVFDDLANDASDDLVEAVKALVQQYGFDAVRDAILDYV